MSYRHNFLVFIIFVVVKLKRGEQIAIEICETMAIYFS